MHSVPGNLFPSKNVEMSSLSAYFVFDSLKRIEFIELVVLNLLELLLLEMQNDNFFPAIKTIQDCLHGVIF